MYSNFHSKIRIKILKIWHFIILIRSDIEKAERFFMEMQEPTFASKMVCLNMKDRILPSPNEICFIMDMNFKVSSNSIFEKQGTFSCRRMVTDVS